MKTYRESLVQAKEARTGITDQRPVRTQSKRPKPIIVESRYTGDGRLMTLVWGREWRKHGAYRDEATAQTVIDQQVRKGLGDVEMRIKP